MRSMIVEDDFTARRLLQIYLAAFGECAVAINGIEAVKAVKEALSNDLPYDLICLDINMPCMGGLEALKLIRQIEKTNGISEQDYAKVIITSANDQPGSIDSACHEGCHAYLVKPIRKAELIAEIKSLGLIEQADLRSC